MKANEERIKTVKRHLTSASSADVSNVPVDSFKVGAGSLHGLDDGVPLILSLEDTSRTSPLTKEQIEQFTKYGYFIVKGLIDKESIEAFTQHFIEISQGEVDANGMVVMKDIILAKQFKETGRKKVVSQKEVFKVQNYENDEVFMRYVRDKAILQYIRPIVGDDIRSIHTMLINKPPDLGKGGYSCLNYICNRNPFVSGFRVVKTFNASRFVVLSCSSWE